MWFFIVYYTKRDIDDIREIMLPECISGENRQDFIDLFEKFCDSEMKFLVLNFKNTRTIDSAGLGFLLIARQELYTKQKELILKSPQKKVRKSFDITNFDNIFNIEY